MLDVCLLGTGGMKPLPYRWLTSCMMRYEGSSLLIDCGEGTQVAVGEKGWSFKPIDYILFTHYHADHIAGLPGFLLTMGNAERTEPLTIIGPLGITQKVQNLMSIAGEIPFELKFIELSEKTEVINAYPYTIEAFRVDHRIICYGYTISLPRAGKFLAERAGALGLPVQLWGRLQKGETVEFEGESYMPEMVMGPPRRGLKVTYTTDTRPVPAIAESAKDADLFICEGMYGEPDSEQKAKDHMHMTFREAAQLAAEAQPRQMWLTHYSPSLNRPQDYIDEARAIFPESYTCRDGKTIELKFEEEQNDD